MPLSTLERSLLLRTPQQRLSALFDGLENPKNCPFPWGGGYRPPYVIMVHWACRHPNRDSTEAHERDQQTDRQTDTDHATVSVAIGHIELLLRYAGVILMSGMCWLNSVHNAEVVPGLFADDVQHTIRLSVVQCGESMF